MDKDKMRLAEKALRDHGFSEDRDTTHGTLWKRQPDEIILLGRSTRSTDPRGWMNLRASLRRYGIDL